MSYKVTTLIMNFSRPGFSSGGVDVKGLATDLVNFPTHLIQCGGDSYTFAMTGVPYHSAWAWTCLITASPQILKPRTAKVVQAGKCVYNGYTLLHRRYLNYCIRPCVEEYSIAQMLLKKTWVGALVMMEGNFAWWSDRLSLQNRKPE